MNIVTEESDYRLEMIEESSGIKFAIIKTKAKNLESIVFIGNRERTMDEGERITGDTVNLRNNKVIIHLKGMVIFESEAIPVENLR